MQVDTLILGAGAAGMMCAAACGGAFAVEKPSRDAPSGATTTRTLVIDHAKAPGEKIRISGGGRCNFTNMHAGPDNFLSANPHFAKSALSRYTQWDFLDLVQRYGIAWHEKTLGQLFCDGKATQIVEMLRTEMTRTGAELWLQTRLTDLTRGPEGFVARLERDGRETRVTACNLVLATGGKSIPKMGATGMAYDIARQFGLSVTETRPALVPLTFTDGRFAPLSGLSLPVGATANGTTFDEALLFTHRGLSGPAILQISSFWREGDAIRLDLAPGRDLFAALRDQRQQAGRRKLVSELGAMVPAKLADHLGQALALQGNLADQSDAALRTLCDTLHGWELTPSGSEGYRTAEVTLGGIDTAGLNSKTMEAKALSGLYVIGEAMDVTGWLGGYNFQWAWSSAVAAGRAIAARMA
ncbi:NAD(P)/FAD-dependent oxidoreductase [Mesobacterium pallidum]|uniref:NAD(P)/FAD-dependent oxidoreductase n=1 Tax=Mesobacterium pallidum TaxID=2872037 RepID=UPI001EE37603|nr:NAD(P)/FAD-dependent oxidoreductase [Mesobacterium pallidum]